MNSALLNCSDVTLELGGKKLCSNLNLAINAGECWAILGRNGAGKTTLLKSLMGLHQVQEGKIALHGQELRSIPKRELATRMGMLFQSGAETLPATVIETVLLGRHPHSSSWFLDSSEDRDIAWDALKAFQLDTLAERQLDSLSGGEQQRLALAMLYTQKPEFYLLDEPSNHLDIAFQLRLLEQFLNLIRTDNASFMMATHDINLAARFCDHVLLLLGDGEYLTGKTEEVLTEEYLGGAFQCEVRRLKEGHMTLF